MRSQVINMVGYAGDITTARERLGIYSALIMVKGGASDTEIKVVTCSTSDGQFTDYVTLEEEGSASLVKGYYVDLSGADKYVKVTGATFADVVFGDCDFDPKGITASGSVPVVSVLEDNKAVTINASTYTEPVEITPTAGKDGMKKATVTLSNIPSGSGANAYCWHNVTLDTLVWCDFDVAPDSIEELHTKYSLDGSTGRIENWDVDTYIRTSDTKFEVANTGSESISFERVPQVDFTLWESNV